VDDRLRFRLSVALVALALVACTRASEASPSSHDSGPVAAPRSLRETGLYAADGTTVADGILWFSPQYPLWTDGATKLRYLALPPGTSIDASDPEAWSFPIGTRIWKEFSFGRRAETRYMALTERGWIYATYVWNAAGDAAFRSDDAGAATSADVSPGVPHRAPSVAECRGCHENAATPVLGFSLLQLSSDRDPGAPHAAASSERDVDLQALVARGLVRNLPARFVASPPRITARSPDERAALGYLHGNCGGCHRDDGPLASLGMSLAYVDDGRVARAIATTFGVPSGFVPDPFDVDAPMRIAPGDSAASVLLARVRARDPVDQMPPLGTHLVDDDAVALLDRWIAAASPTR